MNGWGAVNDVALIDLGLAPVDGRGARCGSLAAAGLLWSYTRAEAKRSVRVAAGLLKALGFAALAMSLLEPLLTGSKPRRGANAFVILADNSQSLQIRNGQRHRHQRRLDARRACGEVGVEDAAGPGLRRSQLRL